MTPQLLRWAYKQRDYERRRLADLQREVKRQYEYLSDLNAEIVQLERRLPRTETWVRKLEDE